MLIGNQVYRCVVLVLILLLSVYVVDLTAQENGTHNDTIKLKPPELLTIESKPSGAIVELEGLYDFTGKTPFVVPYPIYGKYQIKATKEGYESVTSNTSFTDGGQNSVLIKLKRKTRAKAAFRSMLFPGWGQFYGGNKLRGFIISTVQVGLGIGTFWALNDYNHRQNELERALEVFERNMDEKSFLDVQDKLMKAQDDYDFRNTMIAISAAFWIYNIFDSLLFFRGASPNIEIRTNPLSQNVNDNNLMVTWKIGI
ncbi:MAG: PEGA domain-containing protein [Aliifodinibius sp.]|nr:PEGA domain-containing protein [Fodinibius sp.]NIY27714.1 PEGA domain-containing protein [Fodinibius sp.]